MKKSPTPEKLAGEQTASQSPGPWRASNLGGRVYIHDAGVNGSSTARVCEVSATPHADYEANARLIAAAPDLLAALKSIASLGGNLDDEALTSRTGPNDAVSRGIIYCGARTLALAAIAKALPSIGGVA